MLGAFSAFIVDASLVRSETGSRIPPRYLSAAMEDPSRLPYWLVVAGFVVYAMCLPFTAMWQQQLTDELELSFDCSPLFLGATVTTICSLVFLFPMKNKRRAIQVVGVFLHTPMTFLWLLAAFRHAVECNKHLTSALVDARQGSSTVLAIREFVTGTLPVPVLIIGGVVVPLALYAQHRLEITWGRKEGESKVDHDKIFLWSLLPFSLCLVQMVLGAILGLSVILCAVDFTAA